MIFFITVFGITFLLALISFFIFESISIKELLCIFSIQLIITGISAAIIYNMNTSDTEILNGTIIDKKKVRVSCSHSYSCRCRQSCSGSGKNKSCHEVCDTCYDHSNDWDWTVFSTIGELDIDRIDRRGSDEPPRWTNTKIGEPFSTKHSYDNYIKASPDTLFRHQGLSEKYLKFIPKYPNDIFDYYKINRVIGVNGATILDPEVWNNSLSELNSKLGTSKQVNILIVLVKDLPNDYYYALEEAWIGSKKNDVVLVIGINSTGVPQWTEVMTWTSSELFKVKLRDSIMDLKNIDQQSVISALDINISQFHKRKPMAEFEYLTASIVPSVIEWVITSLICLILTICLLVYFYKNDPFEDHPYIRRSYNQFR